VARIDVAPGPTGAVIAFDPWNCGGGIVPAGAVNALRAPAYRGSRRGRAARR
jgi:hypothetical protein